MINDKRLSAIISLVDEQTIADIGTDHGFVPLNLFAQNKCLFAFVTDLRPKCLQKAKTNLKEFSSKICFLQGDGLKPILDGFLPPKMPNSVPKQIIIAGLGGREIKKIILQDTQQVFQKFVLQPQKNVVELRSFLVKNRFEIVKDMLVKEGKIFYNILKVKRCKTPQPLCEMALQFGKTNLQNPSSDFLEFVKLEKEKCQKILNIKKVERVEKRLSQLKKIELGEKNV